MNPTDDDAIPLSASGQARRDQMLADLTQDMRQVHQRRRISRRIGAASVVPALAIIAWLAWSFIQPPASTSQQIARREQPAPDRITEQPTFGPPRAVSIEVVRTNSSLTDAFTISTQPGSSLNDDELLITLASLNRPTGLIRSEGRVWLTSNVTDRMMAQ